MFINKKLEIFNEFSLTRKEQMCITKKTTNVHYQENFNAHSSFSCK